jgi:hypothetical protein
MDLSDKYSWFYLTRMNDCPTCSAPAGRACTALGPPFRERRHHHVARYELARELAGKPIRHAQPIAQK